MSAQIASMYASGRVLELQRKGVRGEQRRADADAERLADAPGDAQHLALAVEVEPVAGLDLERRRSVGDERAWRAAAIAASSALSSAARVARTVDMMPPPAFAISS